MTDVLAKLDALHRGGKMLGFTIWPTAGGYQANLQVGSNTWRIRHGETPSNAIRQVFDTSKPADEVKRADPGAEMLAPPLVDEPSLPDEAHEGEGIFD